MQYCVEVNLINQNKKQIENENGGREKWIEGLLFFFIFRYFYRFFLLIYLLYFIVLSCCLRSLYLKVIFHIAFDAFTNYRYANKF